MEKKRFHQKLKGFCPIKSSEDKKNLHRNLALYSAETWNLFVLTATFSYSNHPDASFQWRALRSQ